MTWLLIDGFNLAFRAYYALPELTRPDGFPTGALHGWNGLQKKPGRARKARPHRDVF